MQPQAHIQAFFDEPTNTVTLLAYTIAGWWPARRQPAGTANAH